MQKTAIGLASLLNIIHDCKEGRIPKALLRSFLIEVAAQWETTVPKMRPEVVLRNILQSKNGTYFCQGVEIPHSSLQCSRVMHVEDLVAFNLDLTQIPFEINGRLTSEQVDDLESHGLRGLAQGTMKTSRPFAWVTRSEYIDLAREEANMLGRPDEAADIARKNLGLNHFQEDEHLIEVKYPENIFQSVKISAPTFLEGCPSLVYRSKTTVDKWGRAVILDTLEDGFPEAVHPEVPFTDDFTIINLGRLSPASYVFDWEAFPETFPYEWNSEALEELESHV